MTIRLEVDYAYNVRASRKERRAKDGRLVKCMIFRNCADLEAALAEARENQKAGEEIAPGYAQVIAVRAYDQDVYLLNPTNAVATYTAEAL